MPSDLTPKLSADSARILALFAKHGHDFKKLHAAHPEITREAMRRVTEELMASGLFEGLLSAAGAETKSHKEAEAADYQIKISLRRSKPPIWRRVVVPGAITLEKLHDVIQRAMGWEDAHLHMHEISGQRFAPPTDDAFGSDWDVGDEDESQFRLCDLVTREKMKFTYLYDFGDSWEHQLTVEKIITDPKKRNGKIVCVSGRGACPPEDCGGTWGYQEMLYALSDPDHERYEEFKDWLGDEFDPAAFDLNDVNRALSRL